MEKQDCVTCNVFEMFPLTNQRFKHAHTCKTTMQQNCATDNIIRRLMKSKECMECALCGPCGLVRAASCRAV